MEKTDIQHIEESGADFFATGNEYMRDALNLNFIPHDVGGGYIADSNRDLQHNYLAAKDIFKNGGRGKIKFVLIGLSPYIVSENDKEPPTVCRVEEKVLEEYLKLCLDNGARPVVVVLPVRASLKKNYNSDVLKTFRDSIKKVGNKYKFVFVDLLDAKLSDKCFESIARLNSEGAAATGALLGSKLYFANVVSMENILSMNNKYFNVMDKYFPEDGKKLKAHIFCRMACNDFRQLTETLPKDCCLDLMAHVFSCMTYEHLAYLSDMLSKDDYNDLAEHVFEISAEKIRHKDKIKVGFCFNYSAGWSGDDLYNLFARDEHFESAIFFRSKGNRITQKEEFGRDLERFKSHGLNVVKVNYDSDIPAQDVLIQLSPYYQYDPYAFRLVNLKVMTLLVYIPYGYHVLTRTNFWTDWSFFRVLWKMFSTSKPELEHIQKTVKVGMPRGIYSGYPKMDIFFGKDANFHFNWKMTRADAKKIIYAPHHAIEEGVRISTFQWNHQFMYEFAKAHPEISWVFKPHPNLFPALVRNKIFPSVAACEEYYQKWNDLPNAQVYTGAYYQKIFATSDGMIHDCASFIAEYQYVDKPMIYLTRDTQKFNELGNEILKVSYTVDGKDLDGIAAMIQRVFIEGDDYKAAERREVFDKYLNYPKDNGMLASEFIYKSISQDLGV